MCCFAAELFGNEETKRLAVPQSQKALSVFCNILYEFA